jgi:hypothetical protein
MCEGPICTSANQRHNYFLGVVCGGHKAGLNHNNKTKLHSHLQDKEKRKNKNNFVTEYKSRQEEVKKERLYILGLEQT